MGVFVIIPESFLTLSEEQEDHIATTNGDDYDSFVENPSSLPLVEGETSSVTDSVELLIERCPLLFNPRVEGDNDDQEEEEEEGSQTDIGADYLSHTEFHIPLNDSPERSGTVSKTPPVPRRRRRFSSSFLDDSFGLLDTEDKLYDHDDTHDDFGDYAFDHHDDDDEDSIDFPSFQFSQPVPRTVVLPDTTCN
mmetsp:Transcript_8981/g.21353  ORF Transcript_8981/g.21353 Transcript_8981/m.21353 type:complete len:193 (+) Transcript_8981:167-745(+)